MLAVALGAIGRNNPATIRTTGWIRVYAVDREMALATITHTCDTIDVDDYLEPFVLPEARALLLDRPAAQPGNYGRIIGSDDLRSRFGRGDFFIVDRGSDHGVTPGAQFVIYRNKRVAENLPFELGEAVAVEVRPESFTLRGTLSRDAFFLGDYVALRR